MPLYDTAYNSMIQRCYNEKQNNYERYGGRGIRVCDRWLESSKAFWKDMGKRPPGLTLDRIDNNGNYEPENCRWATLKEQCANRRPRRAEFLISVDGIFHSALEWSRISGTNKSTIYKRRRRGWTDKQCIFGMQV